MERILQENDALDSLIQRYLDNQSEVTQRTMHLYVMTLLCVLASSAAMLIIYNMQKRALSVGHRTCD